MPVDYEDHLFLSYTANIVRRVRFPSPEAGNLIEYLTEGNGPTAVQRHADDAVSSLRDGSRTGQAGRSDKANHVSASVWHQFVETLEKAKDATSGVPPGLWARRVRQLGEIVGLGRQDVAILEACLFITESWEFHALLESFSTRQSALYASGALRVNHNVLPHALEMPLAVWRERFALDAPLIRKGLLQVDYDWEIGLSGSLRRLLRLSEADHADVRDVLLDKPPPGELAWSDFDHLGSHREDVESVLRGALAREATGVNVLIYGPPGTGKTTFCTAIAERLGVRLFGVGEGCTERKEPRNSDRLAELCLAHELLRGGRQALLLFDEMEDLLSHAGVDSIHRGMLGSGIGHAASKVFLHRVLEQAPVPTLWVTNSAENIDAALLRRMTYAVEMRLPPARIRAGIWSRQLERHGIDATDAEAQALADEFTATPGVAEGAVLAGDLGAGGYELVRRSVQNLSRLLRCDRPGIKNSVKFDPTLTSAGVDLVSLADRLQRSDERRFSLCLDGPPGTGKSAFVRYLADRLGLDVLHRRASDLLGMFVGETEHKIARAFAEARDTGAFLVFDEADSLLADRRGAHRSWEVSMVNEMLTWMECHPLPFACTTNYRESLDSATLRRFLFKVTLGYLDAKAAAAAFRTWFRLEPPTNLAALDALTPGDFDVVRRTAQLMGQLDDANELVDLLRVECYAKRGGAAAIGFTRELRARP